ncbi:MAG: hypothetical protein HY696_12470 [Deltaproteobacteria bacterium]|nr:hypothetical protein [Deltaproteobacteria bacterium]
MAESSIPDLETFLCRYVKAQYFPRHARTPEFTASDVQFFARGVAEVSQAFTVDRASLPRNYFNRKEFRSGYLLYFVLSNYPKAWQCLQQIAAQTRFAGRSPVRILDLGSGPGTASLAAIDYWKMHAPTSPLSLLAVDQNAEILGDARRLCTTRAHSIVTYKTLTTTLTRKNLASALRHERYDIIFLMNVLNELGDIEERQRIVTALCHHHLTPDGVLIIIEPGLQRTTRDLMGLRDALFVTEKPDQPLEDVSPFHILAPCLHQDICPMRAHNARDWCHFALRWSRPKLIADLDRLIGNNKEDLKWSYLILSNTPPKIPANIYRVVSSPLRSKGKIELLLCPATGHHTNRLRRIVRLDKDRAPGNTDLDRIQRGDVVTCGAEDRLTASGQPFRRVIPFQT